MIDLERVAETVKARCPEAECELYARGAYLRVIDGLSLTVAGGRLAVFARQAVVALHPADIAVVRAALDAVEAQIGGER